MEVSRVTLSRQPAAPCNLPQTPIVLVFVTVRSRPQRGLQLTLVPVSELSLSQPQPTQFRLAASRALARCGRSSRRWVPRAAGTARLLLREHGSEPLQHTAEPGRLGGHTAHCRHPAKSPSCCSAPLRTLEDKIGFVPLLVAGLTLALGPPPGQAGLPSSPVGLRAAPLAELLPVL